MLVSAIVDRALEHLNVKAAGQATSADDSDVCIRALVSLLDSWQLDPQTTIGLTELVYTPIGGQNTITIGPTGQIVAPMPARFELSSFYRNGQVDTPLGIANSQDEYNAQPVKTVTGLPRFIYYERGNSGIGTIYLYPASMGGIELHLWVRQDVVGGYQSLTPNTDLVLPNGYRNALEWCLAEEVQSDFGNSDGDVVRKAALIRRKLKRSNFISGQLQPRFGLGLSRGAAESFAQATTGGSGALDGGTP